MKEPIPTIYDVLTLPDEKILSEQALKYSRSGLLQGKFIRLGRTVLLAPTIDIQNPEGSGITTVMHKHMIHGAVNNPDANIAKLAEAAVSYEDELTNKLDPSGLYDAGVYTSFLISSCMHLAELRIFDKSLDYQRASTEGRAFTSEILQLAIGPSIEIINSDKN